MAEQNDDLLLQDDAPPVASRSDITQESSQRDLHDTFQLFKSYMDGKMVDLESKLIHEQDAMSKKIKEEVAIKFNHEGNRIQYNFNEDVINGLNKLHKQIPSSQSQNLRIVLDLLDKIKERNKHIRIADFPCRMENRQGV